MDKFLQKLFDNDSRIVDFSSDHQIIQQGLAPIIALNNKSLAIQKANLLELAKLQNWQIKAKLLFSILTEKNIDFLVFKGFAFTYLLYKQTHIRPYSDIDIIIKQSDYSQVNDVLTSLGYQQYPSRQGQFVSFQNSFYDQGTPQTVIDLHWQINNRIEFHKHFQFSDLYVNSIPLDSKGINFKTLGLIDGFILGCFHYQAHRPQDRKHIWLYDLALIWGSMDSQEQNLCIKKSHLTSQSNIVLSTLSLLNKTFIGCLNLAEKLTNKTNETDEATDYYLSKRNNKISDIKTRLKNIEGLKNKLIFIMEYVFQSQEYVKQRYKLQNKKWVLFFYPRMWLEDVFKLFK